MRQSIDLSRCSASLAHSENVYFHMALSLLFTVRVANSLVESALQIFICTMLIEDSWH